MKNWFLLNLGLLLLASCGNNAHMPVSDTLTTTGNSPVTAGAPGFDQVKKIFEVKCFTCHNGTVHPKNWTVYETAKENLNKINDRLFVTGGMPQVGSLSPAEKAIIKDWIKAGGPLVGSKPAEPTEPTEPTKPTPKPGTKEYGQYLVENKCLGCHGSGAAGMDTALLHGQDKNYLVKQLNDFKNEARPDTVMNAMKSVAADLSASDIEDITGYLSSASACSVNIDVNPGAGNAAAGKDKTAMCMGCHSVQAIAPVVLGQKTGYLKNNLMNFRSGTRKNETMNAMAANLTDEDINDIAAYFNSMRDCK